MVSQHEVHRLTWQVLSLHEADRLLEEGLLGMVEAKRLVSDMRLRLNVHHQDGDGLLVSRVEVHLQMTVDSHHITDFALVASK